MLSAPFFLAGPSPLVCSRDPSWVHFSLHCTSVTFRRSSRSHRVPCLLMTAYCITPPALLLPKLLQASPSLYMLPSPERCLTGPVLGRSVEHSFQRGKVVAHDHQSLPSSVLSRGVNWGATVAPSITLDDIPVPYVTCTRRLGLLISSTLKWSAHVESLLSRVCWKVLKRLLFRCYLSLHTFTFFIHCTPPAVSRICHRCVG